ncbi:MAG: hypothetical protein HQ526_09695 [Actinobacteria bacterium]|nr:hypothetical protein [Actinomycetota bacterium]
MLVNQPELADQIVTTAAGSFLAVGDTGEVKPLNLSGFALIVALLITFWSGLAVANSMQIATNNVYQVPKPERPGLVRGALRSVELLIIIGVGLPSVGILQGIANRTVPGVAANTAIVVGGHHLGYRAHSACVSTVNRREDDVARGASWGRNRGRGMGCPAIGGYLAVDKQGCKFGVKLRPVCGRNRIVVLVLPSRTDHAVLR